MRHFMLSFGVLSLGFAPAPFPKAERGDLARLQGTWVLVAQSQSGKQVPVSKFRVVVAGSNMDLCDERGRYRWRIKLRTKTSPKEMDMLLPAEKKGTFLLCKTVYSLEGDTLKFCYTTSDWGARPRDLSGQGEHHHLRILKRAGR